jgi:thiamine-monophosphate kinase
VGFGITLPDIAVAGVDISDGLIADLGHLARESSVCVTLDADAIPRSPALRALRGDDDEAIIRAVTTGDDYQTAFAANPAMEPRIMAAAAMAGVAVTRIGAVAAGQGVTLNRDGRILTVPNPGYRHF